MERPKHISVRLHDEDDTDIQKVLMECDDKSQRVKDLIRKGIKSENFDEEWVTYRNYRRSVLRRSDGRNSPVSGVY